MEDWWKGRDRTSVLPSASIPKAGGFGLSPNKLPDYAEEREFLKRENADLRDLVDKQSEWITEALEKLREAKRLLS